ncbi:MAG: hypothetical protein ABR613_01685 [Actinomycetota bacterium]
MSDAERHLRDDAGQTEETARRVEEMLRVDAPDARREKAMFVAAVATAHSRRRRFAALAPAVAAVALLTAIGIVSRTAQPGQALFAVRKVLGNVGLAPSAAAEIRTELDRAERLIVAASNSATTEPVTAQELVRGAWAALEAAEELVGELDSDRRDAFDDRIDALNGRAEAAHEAAEEALEAREEAAEEAEDARKDDSSGHGADDDDSSGSGSGSGDDDSSGPGPGGEGDSSGPGSGGDDAGSSGSGSGGGDSSGPGSGDG